MSKKKSVVTLKRELTLHAAEHEVFMSFDGDEDAAKFFDWWNEYGDKDFQKWLARQRRWGQ